MKNEAITNFLINSSILFMGFWFAKISIPYLSFVFVFLLFVSMNKIYITKPVFTSYIFVILFLVFYIIFWSDPNIPTSASYFKNKKFVMFIELFIVLTSVIWVVQFCKTKKELLNLIHLFTIGMLMKSFLITFYTFLYAPYLLELRQVFDPLSRSIANSPAIALMAVFGALVSINTLFLNHQSIFSKIYNIGIIFISLFIMILLQARTPFVIMIFFTIFLLSSRLAAVKVVKIFFRIILILSVLVSIHLYLSESSKYYKETLNNTLERFQSEGLESNRYKQWESAIKIILDHPLGGGSTNKTIENTNWFHNFWLDIGRTSGILPLLVILIYQSHIFLKLIIRMFQYQNNEKKYIALLYISVMIGMFVEIPLEGNIVMFVFYIFLGSIILKYLQLEKIELF